MAAYNETVAFTAKQVSIAILAIFLILIIVFGNILVILAIIRTSLRKKFQYWYIISLAVADLLVGLLVMPFTLMLVLSGRWIFGQLMCEIWLATDVLMVTASILNLCSISLDRYWNITNPIKYIQHQSQKQVSLIIAATWILAGLISFPPLFGWRERPSINSSECTVSEDIGYVMYSSTGSFFLPAVVLVYFYAIILRISRRRLYLRRKTTSSLYEKVIKDTENALMEKSCLVEPTYVQENENFGESSKNASPPRQAEIQLLTVDQFKAPSSEPNCHEGGKRRRSLAVLFGHTSSSLLTQEFRQSLQAKKKVLRQKDIRATATLGVIVLTFIVCWLPFFTIYVCGPFVSIPQLLFDLCFWLGYCNSALNPVIYALMNKQFRPAFRMAVLWCLPCLK